MFDLFVSLLVNSVGLYTCFLGCFALVLLWFVGCCDTSLFVAFLLFGFLLFLFVFWVMLRFCAC